MLLNGDPIYGTLARAMSSKSKNDVPIISGKTDQLTVPIYEDSRLAGKEIMQVKWPKHTLVKAIYRDGQYVVPNGQSIIKAGDSLVLTLDAGQRGHVFSQIKRMQKVEYDG